RGGPGQLCLLSGATGIEADRVLLLGLDRDHPGPAARWRSTAARATRYARLRGLRRLAFVLPSELLNEEENEVLAWVAEGCVGGAYGFDHLKGDKKKLRPKPSSCDLLIDKKDPKAPTRITQGTDAYYRGHAPGSQAGRVTCRDGELGPGSRQRTAQSPWTRGVGARGP
ncbi:MAG: hypothetical protein JRF33_27400, partial [Deltaproteobacteria bacterium]|nr:hypothetical protein [Deltaproteobacteria bacterium]